MKVYEFIDPSDEFRREMLFYLFLKYLSFPVIFIFLFVRSKSDRTLLNLFGSDIWSEYHDYVFEVGDFRMFAFFGIILDSTGKFMDSRTQYSEQSLFYSAMSFFDLIKNQDRKVVQLIKRFM